MKTVCDRHGALLILDEVMCGMGRTGTAHAWQQEGVVPDIQTIGKGLGGGYVPVAGFLAGHRVIDALHGGTGYVSSLSQFFVITDILEVNSYMVIHIRHTRWYVPQRSRSNESSNRRILSQMSQRWERSSRPNSEKHSRIIQILGIFEVGVFFGVYVMIFCRNNTVSLILVNLQLEIVASKTDKRPFESRDTVAMAIHEEGLRQDPGIMLYPGIGTADGWKGDHVMVSPPYTITEEELDMIVDAAYKAIETVCERVRGLERAG